MQHVEPRCGSSYSPTVHTLWCESTAFCSFSCLRWCVSSTAKQFVSNLWCASTANRSLTAYGGALLVLPIVDHSYTWYVCTNVQSNTRLGAYLCDTFSFLAVAKQLVQALVTGSAVDNTVLGSMSGLCIRATAHPPPCCCCFPIFYTVKVVQASSSGLNHCPNMHPVVKHWPACAVAWRCLILGWTDKNTSFIWVTI